MKNRGHGFMQQKISLTKKVIAIALTVLVTASTGLVVLSRINRSATVRAYFWLERIWNEHWPLKYGSDALRGLEARMIKIGILGPARIEVEPGVSFLLDPRDFVPVTILRSGEWQPE